jgi:PPK2 family polyphosphate:nucleotide phosphotransferase
MSFAKSIKRFRIEDGDGFKLSDFDPAETSGLDIDKSDAKDMIAAGLHALTDLQEKLYAQNTWSLLVVLQGMDAAGKDGVIKHVMSGLNPQGCQVHSFKQPSSDELQHDFLWRAALRLPERGRIGIFNRSYYEDVLVVRAKPSLLEQQHLPPKLVTKHLWQERFKSIREFERHLSRNGTVVLKFHLRISKEEQRKRLLARLEEPAKRWKLSASDVEDHEKWDDFMAAYEDAIRHTATEHAPWHVVPADHKWFAWLVVEAVIGHTLEKLGLDFPSVEGKALAKLKTVKKSLEP